jgi:hypothetical protein
MTPFRRPSLRLVALLFAAFGFVLGCSAAQFAAMAPALESTVASLCDDSKTIPVFGLVQTFACPAEEGVLDAAIAAEIASSGASSMPVVAAPSASPSSSPDAGAAAPPMKKMYRRGKAGEPPLVQVGTMPAGPFADAVQARLLAAGAPSSAPSSSASSSSSSTPSLPRAPAVLPAPLAPLASPAGRDGGS